MSTLAPPFAASILTQTLDEFIEQQIAEQGLADEAEYFAKLAEKERIQAIRDYYERECLKAVESDTWIPYTPDFFDKIDEEIRQELQAQQAVKTA